MATHPSLILTRELIAAGHSYPDVRRQVRGLRQLRRGVYARHWPDDPRERHLLLARAVLATHTTDVVLSHVSAALVWGFPVMLPDPGAVAITAIGPAEPPQGDVDFRRHGCALGSRDTCVIDNLPVTNAVRTTVDCARSLALRPAVAIADSAAHAGLLPPDLVRRILSEMRGWKGIGRARRALELVDPNAESPGETWTRLALREAGIRVRSQFPITVADGTTYRVDFLIEGTSVVVEFDGRTKYGLSGDSPEADLWREKRRHDGITMAGYEIVRLTWADLSDPAQLRRLITSALRRSGSRRGATTPLPQTDG